MSTVGDSCGENGERIGVTIGEDGCNTLTCSDGPDENDPCIKDTDRDGVPDYLAGNLYWNAKEGQSCVCLNDGEGTIEMRLNADGCPVPTCSCDCTAGDSDGDGCCDDEDPDPHDKDANCESCEYKFTEKISEIVALFRAKVGVPAGGTELKDWSFDVDLGTVKTSWFSAFGVRFGGNLTTGSFWLGQPGSGVRPDQDSVISEFLAYRQTFRTIVGLCCYLVFAGNVLSAVFNTAR